MSVAGRGESRGVDGGVSGGEGGIAAALDGAAPIGEVDGHDLSRRGAAVPDGIGTRRTGRDEQDQTRRHPHRSEGDGGQ